MEKNNMDTTKKIDLDGYPVYPQSEDIYSNSQEDENADPEDPLNQKTINENDDSALENEKDFAEDESGDDLDVPGTELDDDEEAIGNEDEENNYYSIGGDNHNDLDENQE